MDADVISRSARRGVSELRDIRLDQAAARDWSHAAGSPWRDAADIWRHMSENTHQPRAAELVDWDRVLPSGASVLDLGCGSGWLSALLSRRERVERIVAWDASPHLLTEVLPEMLTLLDGSPDKVELVCGEFLPLLVEDASFDTVVMGSAFHHCAEPEALLAELRRVLKPGGTVLLLNETPWRPLGVLVFDLRVLFAQLARLTTGRGPSAPGRIGQDHVLYDPTLGDHAYTLRGWQALMRRTGWSLELLPTGLTSYPAEFRRPSPFEPPLVHFWLRPLNA